MTPVLLRLGLPRGWPDFRGLEPRVAWTLVGAAAIPLWALWPSLAVAASQLPPFQLVAGAFAVGWLLLSCLERGRKDAESDRGRPVRPIPALIPVLVCALGLTGADVFFILAIERVSPAQANLISYLWPVVLLALGAAFGLLRLRRRHGAALTLGFLGAALVIGPGLGSVDWSGIALAALSCLSWAGFCLYRLRQGAAARDVLARGCGLSALLCAACHLALEPAFVVPSSEALLAVLGIGIAPLALANLAWDRGLRRGDGRLLAVLAYATPLCATLLLVAFGLETPSVGLFAGALLIVAAGLLGRAANLSKP